MKKLVAILMLMTMIFIATSAYALPPPTEDHGWGGELKSNDDAGWDDPVRLPTPQDESRPFWHWIWPSYYFWLMVSAVQEGLI